MPAAVVYPTSPNQIAEALLCASGAGIKVAVRSGGHSYASYSTTEGSLVIDLGAFRAIVMNSDQSASVGAGNKLGDVALGLSEHGRATAHGTCPMVGVGGHATGGGFGLPSRQWGLMLDNVLGALRLLHASCLAYSVMQLWMLSSQTEQ